jgi:hypothetical protein
MPRRHPLVPTLLLAAAVACDGATGPTVRPGSFQATVRSSAGAQSIKSDSAGWVSTPPGLFLLRLVAEDNILGAQLPFQLALLQRDVLLAGGPPLPGSYRQDRSDSAAIVIALVGDQTVSRPAFEWIADSGLLTVHASPADSIFAGDIDAWFHDTYALAHRTYHVTVAFLATPFH